LGQHPRNEHLTKTGKIGKKKCWENKTGARKNPDYETSTYLFLILEASKEDLLLLCHRLWTGHVPKSCDHSWIQCGRITTWGI
jgi:hypothetical protein